MLAYKVSEGVRLLGEHPAGQLSRQLHQFLLMLETYRQRLMTLPLPPVPPTMEPFSQVVCSG